MPRKECSVMDERMQFVSRRIAGESTAELGREFGISHKTGYKIFDCHRSCRSLGFLRTWPFVLSNAMPWGYLRNLTDEDLKAMFAYLHALKPVQHRVDNTEPPTYCRVCRTKHGLGDRD